ncbi:copper amine oxidase N-terminal domain-containing protein [Paenibacillus sp. MCAF9]|uniref:copper amine oxidase N-terminal domain-containing protein n=1 Tax=Paenibacillus sp. MCAF9 TaxID=3233046 RepID=UPI003F96F1C1
MKWSIAAVILVFALLLPTTVSAASQASYEFNWDSGIRSYGGALVKNGVTFVSMDSVGGGAGLEVKWDKAGKRAQYDGWNKSIAVRLGSKTGILDGKMVKLESAPFLYEKNVYLPVRFVVGALGGDHITWDAKSKTIKADHLKTFKQYIYSYDGLTYTVEPKKGIVYVTDGKGVRRELAKLGESIHEYLTFKFQKTPGGLLVLNLEDNYGEPHLHNQLFTLVMKGGKVIQQSSVYYFRRLEQNVTLADGQLLLNDGNTLRLIKDGTGEVIETIDLVSLGGEDDNYFIEYFDKDVFLLRANKNGILKLVNREGMTTTVLYKELLGAKQQEYVETNDLPYLGDYLKFIKREGDILYFKNGFPYDKDNQTYSLSLS